MSDLIAVVGSCNVDHVWLGQVAPSSGETLLADSYEVHPGGKGANQATAAAKLGGRVQMVGCLGKDAGGALLKSVLQRAGVGVSYLTELEGVATGTAGIFVDAKGANSIYVGPGANRLVTADRVSFALTMIRPQWVLMQGETPYEGLHEALKHGRLILNPAPAFDVPSEILARTWLITPNEHEAALLTGIHPNTEEECDAACQALLSRGVQNVVITRGEKGAYASGIGVISPYPVSAVDTTGAGDCFTGALAAALSKGMDLRGALQVASVAAALSTMKKGAQESMPDWQQVSAALSA